jgi:putative DNA methylase
MAKGRPDLKALVGEKLTVIAWLWTRTVKSPNPAFAKIDVPLASTFLLSSMKGKEAYVEPIIDEGGYQFTVKVGKPKNPEAAKNGTKLSRGANFKCLLSGTPIAGDYIKAEGTAGRMGARLMAIVAQGNRGRVYLPPTPHMEAVAREAKPVWRPETPLPNDPRNFWTVQYGLTSFGDLFTPRQLVALTMFCQLVQEARARVQRDAAANLPEDTKPLVEGGLGATAYAEAVSVYLAFAISKVANIGSSIASWMSDRGAFRETFARQALPMAWDFAEANPFADAGGSLATILEKSIMAIVAFPAIGQGIAAQADAASQEVGNGKIVSTDPPYFDNIEYADLSDFFYVWLRRSMKPIFADLFATLAVPKAEELVASPYRHGGRAKAEIFFLQGMTNAMHRLAEQAHPSFPVTIYYAFKQSETETEGTASTGWETFLEAVIQAGFALSGTWPMHTEGAGRIIAKDTNALASSIVLVCRKRQADAPEATRRDFVAVLKAELPGALRHLQRANIAPVDLAQAAIGPGMAAYTRYARILDAEGKQVTVREALSLINQVLDETLAEQEGDFDSDTRWAVAWFEQSGFSTGEFGLAETLSKAKDTSIRRMVDAGILESGHGRVRLLRPTELQPDWDPTTDSRMSSWEVVHHLVRALDQGESVAAAVVAKLGTKAEAARELAYRLYVVCERKKRAQEALSYNALVQSWPEIIRLARESVKQGSEQAELFEQE